MKKIKLEFTLYNPKELWAKFWNRFYWPRRKQCAEWMGFGQVIVENAVISDVICNAEELGINIDTDTSIKLELAIRPKIKECFDRLTDLISKPN